MKCDLFVACALCGVSVSFFCRRGCFFPVSAKKKFPILFYRFKHRFTSVRSVLSLSLYLNFNSHAFCLGATLAASPSATTAARFGGSPRTRSASNAARSASSKSAAGGAGAGSAAGAAAPAF